MTPHGTTGRYTEGGCRCPDCRQAGTLQRKRWKVRTARNGPDLIDPARTRQQLTQLHTKLKWTQMARLSGMSLWTVKEIAYGRHRKITVATARKIDGLWCDYFAPVAPIGGRGFDGRRLPAEPLVQLVKARYGTLTASGLHAQLARLVREGMSPGQCEDWAHRFGMLPEELWPEWLEVA